MFERKIYGERVRRFTDRLGHVLYDAYQRMDANRERAGQPHPTPEEVNLMSWPQLWLDTARGQDGSVHTVPTAAQANVVRDDRLGHVYVYFDGTFVRELTCPTEAFWEAVRRQQLPPANDVAAWEAFELQEPPLPVP